MFRRTLPALFVAASLMAAPVYMVLLKGASALAYYTSDGKLLSSVPVGQHPHEMAFSPDRKLLYITDNGIMRIENAGKGGNTISIVDVAKRQRIGVIPLGENYRPHGIDVDPASGRLMVTTEAPDGLLLVDTAARKVLRRYDTKGKTPHMVTLGPGAKWAYVSHAGGDTVAAVNLGSGDVKLIQTGARPEGSVLSKDGRELYVANREANSITVIDTAKNQAIANISTGKGPVRISLTPDGGTLVYALMHDRRIGFANPKTRTQTGYVLLTNNPVSCTLSQDGRLAFASAEEQDTVYVVSIETKRIVGEIKTAAGAGPDPVLEFPAH
jgi:YVTN family beta-propeller protein